MPTVSLINYTGAGSPDPAAFARDVLLFTKNTRLELNQSTFEDIKSWPEEKKQSELEYMVNTLPSSWEFVDYHFLVGKVTRAFTHQMVRTRTASFAQQAMRIVDMSTQFEYDTGPSILADGNRAQIYSDGMAHIANRYRWLVENGAKIEDARGLLPTNILTNINVKMNMRAFVDLARKRSSPRVQDEYRLVIELMKDEVLRVHPWMALFLERTKDKVAQELGDELAKLPDGVRLIKLLDQLRTEG